MNLNYLIRYYIYNGNITEITIDNMQSYYLLEYIRLLNNPKFTEFIVARDEFTSNFTNEARQAFGDLGFTMLKEFQGYRNPYVGIATELKVVEEKRGYGDVLITSSGVLRNGKLNYDIASGGFNYIYQCKLIINGMDYMPIVHFPYEHPYTNGRGLNIVIWDNTLEKVVDSICFDTYEYTNPLGGRSFYE